MVQTAKGRSLIIMGPPRTGKTTIASIVAKRLNLKLVSLDLLMFEIYDTLGYDTTIEKDIRISGDFRKVFEYWKPYEIKAVEYALMRNIDSVFDFGAGHIFYDDPTFNLRILRLLSAYRNTFYLIPSLNMSETFSILSQRFSKEEKKETQTLKLFLRKSIGQFAKHVISTNNTTPAEISNEIINIYESNRINSNF